MEKLGKCEIERSWGCPENLGSPRLTVQKATGRS